MKSYRVKLKSSDAYFQVTYLLTSIASVSYVSKKDATIFQAGKRIGKDGSINFNAMRASVFSEFLYFSGIKAEDIEVEKFDAPEQPLFNKKQVAQLKEDEKILGKFTKIGGKGNKRSNLKIATRKKKK